MDQETTRPTVTIYSTPTCGYCKLAKSFFNEYKVAYTEKDVSQDIKAQEEMIAKSNQMGVPVIDVNGEIVVGFDQDRLATLLDIRK
ncbi:MAG: glutaredoxin family protein [bacterium]|nr:glutaredoxin family protein [bacterium]